MTKKLFPRKSTLRTMYHTLKSGRYTIEQLARMIYKDYDEHLHRCVWSRITELRAKGLNVQCVVTYQGRVKQPGVFFIDDGGLQVSTHENSHTFGSNSDGNLCSMVVDGMD